MPKRFRKTLLCFLLASALLALCSCKILDGEPVILSDEDLEKLSPVSETDTPELEYVPSASSTPVCSGGVWTIPQPEIEPERAADGTIKSFGTLRELNPDIAGWITMPGTVIDYPVVQGKDNDYYLHHTIYGEEDKNGTLFIHYLNPLSPEYESRVVILFGHHMRSGIMFEDLMQFDITSNKNALEFYKNSGVFTFNSIYSEARWVVFSVMKINVLEKHGPVFNFMVPDFTEEQNDEYQAYIDEIRARSVLDTNNVVDVTTDDRLLVMSTCSYEYDDFRTIIVARQIRPEETTLDLREVSRAEDPVMPDVWDIEY